MSESVNLKDAREMMSEVHTTPSNAKLNDSGYYTFDETPSLRRNRLALTPNSFYYLTPNVTSFPPPEFRKDDFVASPQSQPEVRVPRFQLPLHDYPNPESVPKTSLRDLFASNVETEITFALPIVMCHSCGKDGCHHSNATLGIPRQKNSVALMPLPGQEIGQTHVDFFKELVHSYNCPLIVNRILSFLSVRDLRSVCCVSRKWRQACTSDSSSNAARLKEVEKLKRKSPTFEKENERQTKQAILQTTCNYTRGPFGRNIANVVHMGKKSQMQQKESVTSNGSLVPSRFHLFQEEAKKLLPCERLQPCPRCTSPSRVDPYQKRGFCSRVVCAYDFCIKCSCQYHDSLPCPVLSKCKFSQKDLIGTKSSRRNLKRL